MNEQVTDQAAAVLRFRRLVELIADPDEHWHYRNGEPMAPDAAAFLEYLRGVEQRLVAAEARGAELEAAPPRPRCAYCDQQATTGRTHYYLGFPTARELLCAQHAQNHPFESGGEPLATTEGGV